MNKLILFLIFCISSISFGQQISQFKQLNGHYDYTAIGNTLNQLENSNGFCNILSESSANLTLNSGQTVVSALLYWSGSSAGDFDIKLNGNEITAERTFSHMYSGLPYFAAYADVTSIVEAEGNGTYTFSDMDIYSTISNYCGIGTNYGGWSIIVVYEDPLLLLNQVAIFDGLESVSSNNNSLDITLTNIYAISDQLSKIGFLAWEGDSSIAVNESLFINNTMIDNPPLNPSNNAFNGTNSYTNSNQLYNMDLDFYDLQGIVYPGDTQIDIRLTSEQDFIMVNNIITVVNSELPDGTVVIDGVVVSPQQDEIEVTYTVSNVNSTNVLPANTSIKFYANNTELEEDYTSQDLQIGESLTQVITIAIPVGTPSNFTLKAVIDENGVIPETNEGNNEFEIQISLTVIANPAADISLCDIDNNGVEIFDLTVNDAVIIGSQNPAEHTVTYYETLIDAQNGTNTIASPENYVSAGQTIFARIEEVATGDFDTTNFELEILQIPQPNYNPTPLELCDDDNDGLVSGWDLSVADAEILDAEPDAFIMYYETLSAAEYGIPETEIVLPYTNIVPFNQIVYARVTKSVPPSILPCFAIVELELIVKERPPITQPNNFFINEGDGDGFAVFDLTVNIDVMLVGLNPSDYEVFFYENEADAEIDVLRIANPTAYINTTNPDIVYVRVENLNTGCLIITSFEIATDELAPDADGDGIANEDEDINNNGNLNDDDTDGDGIPNYLDSDDDGDTVLTIDETTGIGAGVAPTYIYIDTDGDGIENYLDNDDDGDGTLTINEDYNNNGTPIDDDTNANGIPDFLDDEVFLSADSFAFEDLSISPNPTSESFTIQATKLVSETTISIYDIQGKLLLSEKMIPQNGTLKLEVSSLENGVYFVKISSEGNSVVKKLLKN